VLLLLENQMILIEIIANVYGASARSCTNGSSSKTSRKYNGSQCCDKPEEPFGLFYAFVRNDFVRTLCSPLLRTRKRLVLCKNFAIFGY